MSTETMTRSRVTIVHLPVYDDLFQQCLDAERTDFWLAVPTWAKEAITECLGRQSSAVYDEATTVRISEHRIKHVRSALACVRSVNINCARQESTGYVGARKTVKRHKRTRAEIRAAKSQPKAEDTKKKARKG